MKINKMLIAVFAMLAVVLSSCKDDDPTIGIDSGMPAPIDFVYDEMLSSNTSISVSWNAERAIAAGATSFTVQLIKSIDAVGDIYDNNTTKGGMSTTIDVTDKENNLCAFNGLKAGRIYYVRIRANYPRSVFSEWILAGAAGAPARIKVGKGIVPDSEGPDAALVVRMGTITESTAIVEWSTTSFADNDADKKNAYTLEIFEDAALSKLNVKWTYGANNAIWAGGTKFILTALKPATKYWARVIDTTNDEEAEVLEFQTNPSLAKAVPTTAAAGDIILYEDFRDLLWGGDLFYNAAGYSATARDAATYFWTATGSDPLNSVPEAGFYLVDRSVEMGMFNTVGKAIPATSLKDWGLMAEDNSAGAICARPGQVKMGASSKCAWLCTPVLSCLTEPATIELTFKAALYGTDPGQAIIEVLDNTTKADNFFITYESRVVAHEFKVEDTWKEYKFTISNVTGASRIAIGANRKEIAGQHRFYLDDISIKLVSYGSVAVDLAAPEVTLDATPSMITASWASVTGAKSYTVEYKKTAAADWTVAGETKENSFKIENLDQKTSYDVRVKATAGDSESDYSEVKTAETLEITGTVTTSLVKATESQLMISWTANNGDATADAGDDWKIELYKDADCTDLDVAFSIGSSSKLFSWGTKWPSPQPAFVFSGLEPQKDYWVKITDVTKAISTTQKYTTETSYAKEIPTTKAAAGDVILYEDFSELLWGSEPVYGCAGYSSNYRTTCTAIEKATGADPLAIDGPDGSKKLYYMVKEGTNMGLFNTLGGAIPNTRLKNWGVIVEKTQVGALLSGVGYLKLGASSECGTIVTPELSCLSGNAKIKVSFDASPYQEAPNMDPLTMKILVVDGASSNKVEKGDAVPGVAGATYAGTCVNVITGGTTTVAQTFSLSSTYGYAPYSYEISGVTPTSRIAIATDRMDVSGQHRCYVDNIKIEVVAYE